VNICGRPVILGNAVLTVMAVIALLFCLFRRIGDPANRFAGTDIIKAFAPFVIIIGVSGLVNIFANSSVPFSKHKFILSSLEWFKFPLAAILCVNLVKSRRAVYFIMIASIMAGGVLSLLLLKNHVHAMGLAWTYKENAAPWNGALGAPAAGFYPGSLSCYLNILLPMALALALVIKNRLVKFMLGCLFLAIVTASLWTLCIGGFFSLIIGALCWTVFLRKKVLAYVFACALTLSITFLFSPEIASLILIGVLLKWIFSSREKTRAVFVSCIIAGLFAAICLAWFSINSVPGKSMRMTTARIMNGLETRAKAYGVIIDQISGNYLLGLAPGGSNLNLAYARGFVPYIIGETGLLGLLAYIYFLFFLIHKAFLLLSFRERFKEEYLLCTAVMITFIIFLSLNVTNLYLLTYAGIQEGINLGLLFCLSSIE